MLPSPSDLTYFLEVANTLNISRASERLGISQPSLTFSIKRLEETIGAALFIRHKRGVYLTQAGKQLFNHARKLLQQWDTIKSETLASEQNIQGYYTLGCHPSIAKYSLPFFLPSIIQQFPKIEIHLKHEISRKITEEVISLNIDLGIVVNPVRHPDLIIVKLFNDEVTLWENKGKVNDLVNPPIICDPELPQPISILKQLKNKRRSFERIITSSSLDVIATLTASGCGVGILPKRVVMSTYPKELSKVKAAPVCNDEVCIVYRHENRHVVAIQTILSAIKKIAEHRS
jgi:LysR family transcriptional regulator, cell division regulator